MPKFTAPVNIWEVDIAMLQPGQIVYAGDDEGPGAPTRGRFFGVGKAGNVVVAWRSNARRHREDEGGISGYDKFMRQYARA